MRKKQMWRVGGGKRRNHLPHLGHFVVGARGFLWSVELAIADAVETATTYRLAHFEPHIYFWDPASSQKRNKQASCHHTDPSSCRDSLRAPQHLDKQPLPYILRVLYVKAVPSI
jgi:hypothetical protein